MPEPTKKSGPPPSQPRTPDLSAMSSLPLLVSPPGMDAPVDLANYTPDLGMMHPSGTAPPRGMLQITPMGPKHMDSMKAAFDRYGKKGEAPKADVAAKTPSPDAEPPKMPKMPKMKMPKAKMPKLRPPKAGA